MGFAAAMASMFANPMMSAAATYTPEGGGAAKPIRVIVRSPDVVTGYAEARFVTGTAVIDLLVSAVGDLREGDQIAVGAITYRIIGDPRRDTEQLCWSADAVEV